MATHQIGRIVTASLVGGLVAAPALVLGPVAGAQEHVIFAGRYPEHVAGMVLLDGRDAQVGWLPLQDRMATLSTNSSHRVVPHTRDALINDNTAAETSRKAIRDVVHAVRSDVPLEKP